MLSADEILLEVWAFLILEYLKLQIECQFCSSLWLLRSIVNTLHIQFLSYHRMLPLTVATLAPVINCVQLVPQLYKTYTTKSVDDLSLSSLLLILTTNLLWLLHGYFIVDFSLIIAGIISMIINTTLLLFYFLYRKME